MEPKELQIKLHDTSTVKHRPLLIPILNMEFYITSSSQEKSSIRIGVKSNLYSYGTRFFHLPPLHRLKNTHPVIDTLKSTAKHFIQYWDELDEPKIMMFDGNDLRELWKFLDAKNV